MKKAARTSGLLFSCVRCCVARLSARATQIPARLHRERVVGIRLLGPAAEPQRTRERDHRAVVGAEREIGVVHVEAALGRGGRQCRAQLVVRADAACDHEALELGLLQCGERLRDQHVDRRVDEAARKVGLCAVECFAFQLRRFELLHLREHGRLQAAEAEVEVA